MLNIISYRSKCLFLGFFYAYQSLFYIFIKIGLSFFLWSLSPTYMKVFSNRKFGSPIFVFAYHSFFLKLNNFITWN